jgi:hypothetical protein
MDYIGATPVSRHEPPTAASESAATATNSGQRRRSNKRIASGKGFATHVWLGLGTIMAWKME